MATKLLHNQLKNLSLSECPQSNKIMHQAEGGGKQCYERMTDSNMKAIATHYYINGEISIVGDNGAILGGKLH